MARVILYHTKTDLKARGWTEALITRFLPQADMVRTNPYYASAPEMRLYAWLHVVKGKTYEAGVRLVGRHRPADLRQHRRDDAVADPLAVDQDPIAVENYQGQGHPVAQAACSRVDPVSRVVARRRSRAWFSACGRPRCMVQRLSQITRSPTRHVWL